MKQEKRFGKVNHKFLSIFLKEYEKLSLSRNSFGPSNFFLYKNLVLKIMLTSNPLVYPNCF